MTLAASELSAVPLREDAKVMGLVGMANHAKQAMALRLAIDDELGVENFVATVLTVGLREHHQFGVSRVAFELLK